MKKCLVCQKNTKIFYQEKNVKILKCNKCGLGITYGLKIDRDYHRDEVYIKEREQFKNIFQRRVDLINKLKLPPGQVLEIGSSTGILLSLLKKDGWDVLGIEVSARSADFARKSGIPTLNTSFDIAQLPQRTFDLIIINHTLEHMVSPRDVLKKANLLLANEGYLFIDVPNFGGFSAKLFGPKWPFLLPHEHLWHFTQKSLEILLKNTGFKPCYFEMVSGIWDYGSPLSELWQSFTGFKKRFFTNFFTLLPTFIFSKLNRGDGLTVISKKVTK